ncbi:MAG: ABC transporter ATP-binding protein [bacterium]|jgi:ABC-2 type transport system ATP-binding protein|nr:ABC transporter ATP-binding protein [bacterium]MDD3804813.1 ABC transporter ATP-binding protein [bacterium]MDD4153425.1 ABC transporter ATP-binding protein [bacterium]MDD4558203.1 ABC transporter ATP-binding protein [bacterium]
MGNITLKAEHLSKVFNVFKAVDDICFEARRGEILGILGPNGAGKTTTVQMLLGLITPTSGYIEALGMDLARYRQKIARNVNFSSAYVNLPANLTVSENLHIFARLYDVKHPETKIEQLLDLLGLQGTQRKPAGQLSSGQQIRLNLCKALLNDPEILFLDEPTSSLDPDIADRTRQLLMSIRQERELTIIFTSHNMAEMEKISDRVLFMLQGKIIAGGRPTEVIQRYHGQSLEEVFLKLARQTKERKEGEL